MSANGNRKLLGKITLEGTLTCLTGLHIGASKENLEIGAVDSPVVRDPVTLQPYIPGSSLKGKLRCLLEKAHPELMTNRDGGSGIKRHECDDWQQGDGYPGAEHCPVCRLFGSTSKGKEANNYPACLKVRDLPLEESSAQKLEKMDSGMLYTELKFENSIDRITSAANPRNLERIPRGAEFSFSMVYDVENKENVKDDLSNLKFAIAMLRDDALGGHGSRGYGQVDLKFSRIEARKVDYYKGERDQIKKAQDLKNIDQLADFFVT